LLVTLLPRLAERSSTKHDRRNDAALPEVIACLIDVDGSLDIITSEFVGFVIKQEALDTPSKLQRPRKLWNVGVARQYGKSGTAIKGIGYIVYDRVKKPERETGHEKQQ